MAKPKNSLRVTQEDLVLIFNCGDRPQCIGCSHGQMKAFTIKGSQTTTINGKKSARLEDLGKIQCPHSGQFKITKASNSVYVDGKAMARVGDEVECIVCKSKGIVKKGSKDAFTQK